MIEIGDDLIRQFANLRGVVIDPGHGGTDPGSSGNGIVEKNYNLDISKYMAQQFRNLGVPVTLTRITDETLTPEERVARVMNAYGNNPDVIVISNHLNAGGGDDGCVIMKKIVICFKVKVN
jgi:N-acetylmuramoyl-L-alanine amidase